MRTVAAPVEAEWVRVEPADVRGITVNGIPATLEHVQKADVRVDLADEGERAFVVEHVLGPLGLCGVTGARVVGTATAWDFARPEHRICYSRGDGPDRVVGHPAGLPNPEIAAGIAEVGVVTDGPVRRRTVTETVQVSHAAGELTLKPRARGQGLRFDVQLRGQRLGVEVDPAGETAASVVDAVSNSRTPYLTDSPHEGVVHSIADLVSDIAILGGLEDLVVTGELGEAYHAQTIGAAKAAHERGLVTDAHE
ncbi:MAG: hypothetical protein ABEJ35_07670 [Halobacteriaceae archaeon]